MLTEMEHLTYEYQRMNPIVKQMNRVFELAIDDVVNRTGELGWREHQELIDAYKNGLSWFINMEGGYGLYHTVCEYQKVLDKFGWENLPRIEE